MGLMKMAISNAEKQAAYRARQKEIGGERLQSNVDLHAKLALQRLSRHYGLTQGALLEKLLAEEVARVTRDFDDDAFKRIPQQFIELASDTDNRCKCYALVNSV